jgi:hypothetical protein
MRLYSGRAMTREAPMRSSSESVRSNTMFALGRMSV